MPGLNDMGGMESMPSQGFKWGDLTKLLGGFFKKPENQRMLTDIGYALSAKYDPRTGRIMEGPGAQLSKGVGGLINREQVAGVAEQQALREQALREQQLAMLKRLMAERGLGAQAAASGVMPEDRWMDQYSTR